ncbi:MAG: PQQ-like beta-propeller repeat protein [Acidobacteriota bacterium]
MPRYLILCLCLILCVGCSSPVGSEADWPQWRGPERNGISNEKGLLQEWPAAGPDLLWQAQDIGDGYSTPSVVGSRLFVVSSRGMDNEFVEALSTEDGSVLWTTRIGNVGNPDQQPNFPMARSTPTVDGDLMYALGSDGDLACLETETGAVRWQKNIRTEFEGVPGTWAYSESPLVDGNVVVVTPGGVEASMVALDKATGDVVWKSAVPGGEAAGYASAIIVQAAGRKQYVQFKEKGLVGIDAGTGRFLWRYDEPSNTSANIPTPVADGDYVYAAKARIGGGLVYLEAAGPGIRTEEIYFKRGLPFSIGGTVLKDGYLYGTTDTGLVAAEFQTGNVAWEAESLGAASVLLADGRLYLHGENGEVALVEATPEAYREKGRFMPSNPPQRNQEMEKAWAYPVVSNGKLYIRDLGTLWCYDVKAD